MQPGSARLTCRTHAPLPFLAANRSQCCLMLAIMLRLCFSAWRLATLAVEYSSRFPCLAVGKRWAVGGTQGQQNETNASEDDQTICPHYAPKDRKGLRTQASHVA